MIRKGFYFIPATEQKRRRGGLKVLEFNTPKSDSEKDCVSLLQSMCVFEPPAPPFSKSELRLLLLLDRVVSTQHKARSHTPNTYITAAAR